MKADACRDCQTLDDEDLLWHIFAAHPIRTALELGALLFVLGTFLALTVIGWGMALSPQ